MQTAVSMKFPPKAVAALRAYSDEHKLPQNRVVLAALLQAGVISEEDLVTTTTRKMELAELPTG